MELYNDMTHFLTSWCTFWRHGTLLRHDTLFDVLVHFLTSWLSFWRHGFCFTLWQTFCHHDVFLSLIREQNIMKMWFQYYNEMFNVMTSFWCYDEIVDVMTLWLHDKLFKSRHMFDFMTNFLHHDIFVTAWQTFDVMTKLLTPWRVFDVMTNVITNFVTSLRFLLIINLTSCRLLLRHAELFFELFFLK